MLVGEWGAYDRHPDTLVPAQDVVRQFEQLLCSETYWTYLAKTETFPCFQAINRPYPARIAGDLHQYAYDPQTNMFSCTWLENGSIDAPSIIYIPSWIGLDKSDLQLTPESDFTTDVTENGWFLQIQPLATEIMR